MTSLTLPPGVVWRPLPGSQVLALSCPAQEVLYEGTRGPGKTDTQLMRFRRNVGRGYGSFWRGIIMDREYKNLEDLIVKSLRTFKQFGDGAKFLSSTSELKWVWPTGEELLFRVLKRDEDYYNYHGHEYPFQGWNELTKYQHNRLYEAMLSTNRSSFVPEIHSPIDHTTGERMLLPPIPLEVFSTTNPYGPGHGWVKREWIDPAPPGVPMFRTTSVYNPRTKQREDVVRSRVRIFGSYKENPYLDAQYIATLENISDDAKRRAWLWGDWDIVAGGAFADLWGPHLILPRFKVPSSWTVTRSFDWGSSAPFSVGWNAEASGEEATLPDGSTFCPPRGSIIRVFEWYGSKDGSYGLNEGCQMSAKKMAEGILERDKALVEGGWVPHVKPGPADNSIWNQIKLEDEDRVDSIAKTMEEAGVSWERSIKSPGSRIQGLQLWRDRMENVKDGDGPGWWCTENCRTAIACLPTLQRDPKNLDDVDTESEDHLFDEGRYAILAADAGATNLSKLRVF